MLCITFLTEKVTNSIHNMTYDADGLKSSTYGVRFFKKTKNCEFSVFGMLWTATFFNMSSLVFC